ncbi:MAG: serine hydrolase [Patescibacteria group bacterium]
MFPFKKKQSEEEVEQQLQEQQDSHLPARKRRKEPIKPWGRKERYLVLSILLFTTLTSAVLAMAARDWKLPGLPKLSFSNLNLFDGGEIIIENKNKNKDSQYESIIAKFRNKTNDLSGTYGLYVVDLTTSDSYGLAQNEIFQAASLIKLPTMVAYYKEVEKGNIKPTDKYVLKDADKIDGSGSLQYEKSGKAYTYQQLVDLMGKQSDNTAFNVMTKKIGEEKINTYTLEFGMAKTSLANNDTTPADIGIFFEKLWKGKLISDQNKEMLLTSLTDTIYEDFLPKGIPEDIRVAHKFGREVHVLNDAGIIYIEKPFVLVLMTKGIVDKEVEEIFPELVRDIYTALN